MRKITKIILHWFGEGDSHDMASQEYVDSIRRQHMALGWKDIGYHYLIDRNGVKYKGRHDNIEGAHTLGYNHDSIGVNLLYGTKDKEITSETYSALLALLHYICDVYNIPRDNIFGHRDFLATQCPGDFIYRRIPKIISDLKYMDANGGQKPSIHKFKVMVEGRELRSALIDGIGYVAINELSKYFPIEHDYNANTKTVTLSIKQT